MSEEPVDIKSILFEALEKKDSDERAAYLDGVCGGNTCLRAEAESLLESYEKAADFLPSPDLDPAVTLDDAPLTEGLGTVIGRYKLLEKIGEGGMATVYMAEQERPVHRKVALKIIKLGMDTKQVIARFEAERQALAMMEHPNIAKVFDGGATETGRPYFVMELVKGVSITEYCDKNKLSTQERLNLFIQVCKAVQHAHQKGIIHRDIKPSNIMVTLHDGTPVPKVIDFGIAKATNQRLTEKTLFTRYAQMIGTPAYMSPEQAEMSGLDVDTRTDIYSLSVLLYELLTGTTPFDGERLSSAGYLELQRIIREEEPTKPSTKLSTLGEILTEIAKHRDSTPGLLRKAIRGDLDWIVMKALEKDRTRRYETAHELALDIQRHMRHEPIIAGSPGTIYFLQKFWRRHRAGIVTAAVITVLLVGSVVGVLAYLRSLRVRWARQEALPMIIKLAEQKDYLAAFFLAKKTEEYIPNDPMLVNLWPEISRTYLPITPPDGAKVYYKVYSDIEGQWLYLGQSPYEKMRFPRGVYRWKIVKDGFETRECVAGSFNPNVEIRDITLKEQDGHSDMVLIDSQSKGRYLIDKFEVTNEQYKEFVDNGGYEKRQYWKQPFTKDGQEVPWEQAMRQFCDKTGQPGPATWEKRTYPKRQGNYPVSGVSWYEAVAYAEFVGKSLPTVSHWSEAACFRDTGVIIPYSNFGQGPAPVGSHHGMGFQGLYDMAGNVREWCYNAVDDSANLRYILGGAWTDPEYMFSSQNTAPPWDRSPRNGFRCASYLSKEKSITESFFKPIERRAVRDLTKVTAHSEEEFRSYKQFYSYDWIDLEAQIESIDKSPTHWRTERITFNAAYGNERVIAYLFIPKEGKPPFQPVVYFPGGGARETSTNTGLDDLNGFDFIVRSGRAFVWPIYKGTYERRIEQGWPNAIKGSRANRDWTVQVYQDLARSIDYLESRDDMDLEKLTYLGLSWGAIDGHVLVALEDRIRRAIFVAGGCWVWHDSYHPAADPAKFAGHIKVPTIMLNGIYDEICPYETSQKPTFELLGTPAEHKVHKTYRCGHPIIGLFREEFKRDVLEWLDR